MKKPEVCEGCKYYIPQSSFPLLSGSCDYSEKTGHSRLVKEMEKGGVRKDRCPCYERGKNSPVIVKPAITPRKRGNTCGK